MLSTTDFKTPQDKQLEEDKQAWRKFIFLTALLPFILWILLCLPGNPFKDINIYNIILFLAPPLASYAMYIHYLVSHKNECVKLINETKEEKIPPSPKKSFLSIQFKSILSLSPIAICIAFLLTLYYYNWIFEGNTGLALQVASLQLTQNKYKILSSTLLVLFVSYLILFPALVIELPDSESPEGTQNSEEILYKNTNQSNKLMSSVYQITLFTFIAGLIASTIFWIIAPNSHNTYIQHFILLAFQAGQFKMGSISPMSFFNDMKGIAKSALPIRQIISLLGILVLVFIFIKFAFPRYMAQAGEVIVNTKSTNLNPIHAYSCIFSKKDSTPLAFGIIVSSKETSVHIFTPEYDRKNKSYTHITQRGMVTPNNPIETYINIKENYIIEQYNELSHEYNSETGTCTRK